MGIDKTEKTMPDKVIEIDILNDSQIGVFTNLEKIKQWFTEHDMHECFEHCDKAKVNGIAFFEYDKNKLPWFLIYLKKDCSITTVCHEALHSAWFLLHQKGIDVNIDNHEILAYLQEYITKEIGLYLGLIKDNECQHLEA